METVCPKELSPVSKAKEWQLDREPNNQNSSQFILVGASSSIKGAGGILVSSLFISLSPSLRPTSGFQARTHTLASVPMGTRA